MRIISGSAKGTRLKSPPGKKIRPTSHKVKGAFFNMIQNRIVDSRFLDLFSGSGAVGLEAMSRGARACLFVDRDRDSIKLTRENIKLAKLQEKASVRQADVLRFIGGFSPGEKCFDIIYIDPPYLYDKISEILFLLGEGRLLVDGGIVAVERPSNGNGKWGFSPFLLLRKKIYGDTILYLLGSCK